MIVAILKMHVYNPLDKESILFKKKKKIQIFKLKYFKMSLLSDSLWL